MEKTPDIKKIQHLYLRAGFGINYKALNESNHKSIGSLVDKLFYESKNYTGLTAVTMDLPRPKMKDLSEEEKKQVQKDTRDNGKQLKNAWLQKMEDEKGQLREKMTLFWHGHFACKINEPYLGQMLNNSMRDNAFGKFKDLLMAVSPSPAMLLFLNNEQNKKEHPNENFAREVMELFTIGRGNYTENDIKEAARAFTGWSYNLETGEFQFRPKIHDEGNKKFMGQEGNIDGEDVIDIILANKRTSVFLSRKIYKYFVNDTPDEDIVKNLADYFYSTNYNIESLMRKIYTSDWFYDEKNIGGRIKSPIELLIGINRTFNVKYEDPDVPVYLQKLMGQELFEPPNVSGWPAGKNWIDSSSLMTRMKLPSVILNGGIIDVTPKEDLAEMSEMMMAEEKIKERIQQKVKTTADWDILLSQLPKDIKIDELAGYFLQPNLPDNIKTLISNVNDGIKMVILQLISTPEYQLC